MLFLDIINRRLGYILKPNREYADVLPNLLRLALKFSKRLYQLPGLGIGYNN